MSEDLAFLSASELVERYRAGTLSPVEATRAVLDRIERLNGRLNAYCLVDEDGAMAAARESEGRWRKGEPRGLVDGVPTSIKDLVLTRGWPTLRGSKTVDPEQPWDEDAPATARLREHGAVLLGKTTTPEFGWKGVTDSPLTGITRNPWNLDRTPGGSSGGAAAHVAAGMGQLAVGTDGGGSVRIPAAFSGIVGLKPSFGRVPAFPLSPFGTLSHVGPMARTVADAALMLTVLAGGDARDWHALPRHRNGTDYRRGLDDGVAGLKVAFSPTLGYARVDPEVAALTAAAARAFEDLGARVEEIDPGFENPEDVFRLHWYAGAANGLRALSPEQMALVEEPLVRIVEKGRGMALLDYLDAVNRRGALGVHMKLFHERFDLLLTPALAVPAFAVGQLTPDGGDEWMSWTPFSYPFNLTQQPALSVPCGFTAEGLPVGLQIVGPMHGDRLVLRAGKAYEAAHPTTDRRPPL